MHRLLVLFAAIIWGQVSVAGGCADERISLRGDWGQINFNVEIADTGELRARGLMFRERMPQFDGMLFIFPDPRPTAFWMRNTLIPLDILFADETGVVTHIHENAIPLDETLIPGGDAVKYVLEINGGLSKLYGISEGTQFRHPLIPNEVAIWPCG